MGYQRRVHGDCTLGQCSVTMLRPLLLLLPCLLALAWDMDDLHARGHLDRDIPGFDQEFEDMEDELEEDFEEERSLNTDDFDEHADDMEDLEDLTPEEVEDREAILDDREGRLAGPIVRCGRWTNRVVELDGNTTAKFESTKITNRCTVLYKPTNCTGPIKLTCSKFLVDNRDPMHCKKGDSFITKPAAKNNTVEQPRIWCKREGPSENFPSLSPYGNLKVWYKRSTGQLGTGRFPKKGVRCSVSC